MDIIVDESIDLTGSYYSGIPFLASYNQLVKALGEPVVYEDNYKTFYEWLGSFDGKAWSLYDWKEDFNPKDKPNKKIGWHIGRFGGEDALDVNLFVCALRNKIESKK